MVGREMAQQMQDPTIELADLSSLPQPRAHVVKGANQFLQFFCSGLHRCECRNMHTDSSNK